MDRDENDDKKKHETGKEKQISFKTNENAISDCHIRENVIGEPIAKGINNIFMKNFDYFR